MKGSCCKEFVGITKTNGSTESIGGSNYGVLININDGQLTIKSAKHSGFLKNGRRSQKEYIIPINEIASLQIDERKHGKPTPKKLITFSQPNAPIPTNATKAK